MNNQTLTETLKTLGQLKDNAEELNLKQVALLKVIDQALQLQDKMNATAELLKKPLIEGLKKLEDITAKLNNSVDVNKALDKLEQKQQDFSAAVDQLKDILDNDPEKAAQLEKMLNDWADKIRHPEDSTIVQDTAEKILSTTIKTGFLAIKPMVSSIGALVPGVPLTEPLNAVIEAIDGVVEIAATNIPDEELDKMASAKLATDMLLDNEKNKLKDLGKDEHSILAKNIADKATSAYDRTLGQLGDVAKNVYDSSVQIAQGLGNGIKKSWKDFKCPELPPNTEKDLKDFIEAIKHFCSNIDKAALVLIFQLIGQIFDCFKQVTDALGVPEIPAPLSQIPKIMSDYKAINDFKLNLPTSLYMLMKAILKKKIKQISIMSNIPSPIPKLNIESAVSMLGITESSSEESSSSSSSSSESSSEESSSSSESSSEESSSSSESSSEESSSSSESSSEESVKIPLSLVESATKTPVKDTPPQIFKLEVILPTNTSNPWCLPTIFTYDLEDGYGADEYLDFLERQEVEKRLTECNEQGYWLFVGWDKDCEDGLIDKDTTVKALYKFITYETLEKLGMDLGTHYDREKLGQYELKVKLDFEEGDEEDD